MIRKERVPIILLAMICLLSGLWSGLSRIGWDIPLLPVTAHHGVIMVSGFIGTLISLEKIIPLKRNALHFIPLVNVTGVILLYFNQPLIAISIFIAASIGLTIVFISYFRSHGTVIYGLMLCGAICWLIGNCLLLTRLFYPLAFPWWLGFALFIIAAERLEIMKFLPVKRSNKFILIVLLALFLVGTLLSFHGSGMIVSGISLIGCSLWLLRNDMIGINITRHHIHKFTAVSLLTGYIALLMTGIFALASPGQPLSYDVIVHSFFIGFVFSMIFAHGPMILPGIIGISTTPFHPVLYLWLTFLHASWVIRVFADLTIDLDMRMVSGGISAVAIVGYFVTIGILTVKNRRHAPIP